MELDSLKAEVVAAEQAVSIAERAFKEASDEEEKIQMKVGEANARYEETKLELNSAEEEISRFSSELKTLKAQKSDLIKRVEKSELQAKKLAVEIAKIQKEQATAEKFVESMLKKYEWIETEKGQFGVPGGDYDFTVSNPSEMSSQLKELKAVQESLVSVQVPVGAFTLSKL